VHGPDFESPVGVERIVGGLDAGVGFFDRWDLRPVFGNDVQLSSGKIEFEAIDQAFLVD
jgi:hypothetical protein